MRFSVAARPGGVPFASGSDFADATADMPCCYRNQSHVLKSVVVRTLIVLGQIQAHLFDVLVGA